jgi:hypothetical protein
MRLVAIFMLAALVGAGAVRAQQTRHTEAEDIRATHNLARCIAQRREGRVRALLAMDFRDPDYGRAMRRVTDSDHDCVGLANQAFRANQRFMMGRMAETLLLADLRGGDLAARVALDPARPALQARNEEEMMSLCAVRTAPVQAAAIFATAPASADEAAAVRVIVPVIGQCLAAGARGEFNRPAIRSNLALAAYRLVQHNAAPASVPAPRN